MPLFQRCQFPFRSLVHLSLHQRDIHDPHLWHGQITRYHIEKSEGRIELSGERDRVLQCFLRTLREVDRHENFLELERGQGKTPGQTPSNPDLVLGRALIRRRQGRGLWSSWPKVPRNDAFRFVGDHQDRSGSTESLPAGTNLCPPARKKVNRFLIVCSRS